MRNVKLVQVHDFFPIPTIPHIGIRRLPQESIGEQRLVRDASFGNERDVDVESYGLTMGRRKEEEEEERKV